MNSVVLGCTCLLGLLVVTLGNLATSRHQAANGHVGHVYTFANQQDFDKERNLTLSPGDAVRFRGGATFRGTLTVTSRDSDPARPIAITSYGKGAATIATVSGQSGIVVRDTSGVVISHLNVKGAWIPTANFDPAEPVYGILVQAVKRPVSRVRVEDCTVSGYKDAGICLQANTLPNRLVDAEIAGCTTSYNGINGIVVEGGYSTTDPKTPKGVKNLRIRDCTANENHGCFTLGKDGYSGHGTFAQGIYISGVDGALIDHCLAHRNGGNRKRALQYYDGNQKKVLTRLRGPGGLGIWAYISNDVVIQYCEASDTVSADGDGGGFDLDGGCTHCTIQYCYSHGTYGDGIMACPEEWSNRWSYKISNDVIRYNVVERLTGSSSGISVIWYDGCATADNIALYNNVVYLDRRKRMGGDLLDIHPVGLSLGNAAVDTNTLCANNIVITGDGVPAIRLVNAGEAATSHLRLDYNCYYAPAGAELEWGQQIARTLAPLQAQGFERHGSLADPKLTSVGRGGHLWTASASDPSEAENGTHRFPEWAAYRLKADSPSGSTGARLTEPPFNLVEIGSNDLFGQPLPASGAISIGVDQASAGR